ncbi:MAG TPA: PorV/PorQ family protein [bacterium]|nr:PorV/PorQ family protein [bacterium]
MKLIKMMVMILLPLFLGMVVVVTDAAAAEKQAGYHFLRSYAGARPSAMAGAFISMTGDIHSTYFNPAGLAEMPVRIASASYLNHILDFHSGSIAYSQPIKKIGQMGVALNYMSYGEFSATDVSGNKTGSFNAGSFYLTTSLARKLSDNLMVGGSSKFIHSTIDNYSSSAIAVDLGVIYHVPFIEGLNIGCGVFNLGTALSTFIEEKDPLPLNLVGGFSKKLEHLPLEYSVAVNKYIDDDIRINVGGEFTLTEGAFLRLGYNSLGQSQKIGGDGDQFAGVSLGLGFHWRSYQFDYGLSSYGAIGFLNQISFSYQF